MKKEKALKYAIRIASIQPATENTAEKIIEVAKTIENYLTATEEKEEKLLDIGKNFDPSNRIKFIPKIGLYPVYMKFCGKVDYEPSKIIEIDEEGGRVKLQYWSYATWTDLEKCFMLKSDKK